MNILDSIVVEESIRDAKLNGAVEKARTQIMKLNGWGSSKPANELDDDVTEYDPEAGYTVQSRDVVTGTFDEGVKVHNPSTFRLEPAKDGSSDSPFA